MSHQSQRLQFWQTSWKLLAKNTNSSRSLSEIDFKETQFFQKTLLPKTNVRKQTSKNFSPKLLEKHQVLSKMSPVHAEWIFDKTTEKFLSKYDSVCSTSETAEKNYFSKNISFAQNVPLDTHKAVLTISPKFFSEKSEKKSFTVRKRFLKKINFSKKLFSLRCILCTIWLRYWQGRGNFFAFCPTSFLLIVRRRKTKF